MTRLALILAGAALFVGCQFLTAGSDLEVTVDVRPRSLRPGLDTVLITVAAHNRSDREVTVSGSGTCILRYEVSDLSGQRLPASPRWCTDDLRFFRIAPRDSLAWTFTWSGELWPVIGAETTLLTSGVYRVTGVLNATERQERSAFVEIVLIQP